MLLSFVGAEVARNFRPPHSELAEGQPFPPSPLRNGEGSEVRQYNSGQGCNDGPASRLRQEDRFGGQARRSTGPSKRPLRTPCSLGLFPSPERRGARGEAHSSGQQWSPPAQIHAVICRCCFCYPCCRCCLSLLTDSQIPYRPIPGASVQAVAMVSLVVPIIAVSYCCLS